MMDDDVTNKKGIYEYILTRNEKHLSIRNFSESQKKIFREIYTLFKGYITIPIKNEGEK